MMKIILMILGLSTVVLGESQGKGQQPSIDSPEDANQFVDQFIQQAQQYSKYDSAKLQDVQFQFQFQKPSGSYQAQIKFSQGKVSNIFSQAQRYGQSQVQKQGQKQQFKTPMQFQQLSVQYNSVQAQTQPQSDFHVDSVQGLLQNVKADLSFEYNQQSGQVSYKGLSVYPAQQSSYSFKGAEKEQSQYPQFEKQAGRVIQQAVAKALQQQMQQAMQQYGQQYQ